VSNAAIEHPIPLSPEAIKRPLDRAGGQMGCKWLISGYNSIRIYKTFQPQQMAFCHCGASFFYSWRLKGLDLLELFLTDSHSKY
jgi:hypothetical protein